MVHLTNDRGEKFKASGAPSLAASACSAIEVEAARSKHLGLKQAVHTAEE